MSRILCCDRLKMGLSIGLAGCLVGVGMILPLTSFSQGNADKPASTEDPAWRQSQIEYVQAQLRLAEARLETALKTNAEVARVYPLTIIQRRRAAVELAKLRLQRLGQGGQGAERFGLAVAQAELAVQAAVANYQSAKKVTQQQARPGDRLRLAELQAAVGLAEARLKALKALKDQPPVVRLQWELDQLWDRIDALRADVEKLGARQ